MANKKNQVANPEVTEALNKSEQFYNKNKKVILGALVAIVVIIVGIYAYVNLYQKPHQDKASTELAKAQDLFANEQYDKAAVAFQAVLSDYSGTDASNLANLYLGLCYANQNKWQDAVKYIDAYDSADDAMVSPAAMAALGNAYAHTGDLDKAVSCLKKAASMADDEAREGANFSISATFLMQAAQILESQNKADEALSIYKDVKTKYVNAPQVQSGEIDKYIERLEEK